MLVRFACQDGVTDAPGAPDELVIEMSERMALRLLEHIGAAESRNGNVRLVLRGEVIEQGGPKGTQRVPVDPRQAGPEQNRRVKPQ